MKTFIIYITRNGELLARRLRGLFPTARVGRFKEISLSDIWDSAEALIFIMATGIVVRSIAPFIKDKKSDPAVVVIDEKAQFVISLLSGHLGGANDLSRRIGEFLGASPVITTASDINSLPSIDLWAKENDLVIEDWDILPRVARRFIEDGVIKVYSEIDIDLPSGFMRVEETESADLIITNRKKAEGLRLKAEESYHTVGGTQGETSGVHRGKQSFPLCDPVFPPVRPLILRPKNLVIGIGCNSGTTASEIESAVRSLLEEEGLSFKSIHSIATLDKKTEEKGLVEFTKRYGLALRGFTSEELNSVKGLSISEHALKAVGARAVAEPAAILAGGNLIVPKRRIGNVTVAVALRSSETEKGVPENRESSRTQRSGRLYILGTGPGDIGHITLRAIDALMEAEVVVGYSTYIDLIKDLIKNKEVITTGMTEEIKRAEKAVELALEGRTVAVISGGDPGIYGMAGLVLEILKDRAPHQSLTVEIIPGVSALNACASRLGAPLTHDFACISLSDRLTDWETIEKRLHNAASGDFVTVLYNPRSHGRQWHIIKARDIFLKYRDPETPVGIVKSAMRDNERIILTTLKEMPLDEIDMQTTVIIGNSRTYIQRWQDNRYNWMITPRGYERRFNNS